MHGRISALPKRFLLAFAAALALGPGNRPACAALVPAGVDIAGPGWQPALVVIPPGHRARAARAPAGVEAECLGTSGYDGYTVALLRVQGPPGRALVVLDTEPGGEPAVTRRRHDPEQARRAAERIARRAANPEALAAYAPPAPRRPPGSVAAAPPAGFRPTFDPSLDGSGVRYLVVTSAALAPHFAPLADWKTRRGVPAQIRTIEWIEARTRRGVDRAETLRNFLVEAYALWGVEYVLLGGDTDILPARFAWSNVYGGGTSPADLYFACLDGTWNADGDALWGEGGQTLGDSEADILPELAVTRAPVSDAGEAQAFVNRILSYERPLQMDYQHRAVFLTEVLVPANWDSGSSVIYDGAPGSEQMRATLPSSFVAERLYDTYWMYPGSARLTKSRSLAAMNAGAGIVNQLGHGYRYTMSVGDGRIVNADADGLANAERPFILCMANCAAVAFDYDCLAEHFLLNPGGGAAGILGAARSVSASLIVLYNRAFFEQLFVHGRVHLGELLNEVRLARVALAELDGTDRWIIFSLNVLGDPEMPLFTAPVRAPALVHAATVPMDADTLDVVVSADSAVVPGALVCAQKGDEVYAVAAADAAGRARLAIAPETPGALFLTVSGRNLAPRTDTLQVVPPPGAPRLAVAAHVVDDDTTGASAGDADGGADAGETLELWLDVGNAGGAGADSVLVVARALDTRLTVLADSVRVGSLLAPQAVTTAAQAVVVRVGAGVADGTVLDMDIDLTAAAGGFWRDRLRLLVSAPRPEVTRVDLLGPDSLATARFAVEVKNYGSGAQAPLVVRLLPPPDSTAVVVGDSSALPLLGPLAAAVGAPALGVAGSPAPPLRIEIGDALGRVFVHAFDLAPPPPPALPAADLTAGAGVVRLTWTPVAASDLYGYHVFRSLSAGVWVRLTPDAVHHADYYDTTAQANSLYRYCVVAVDSSRHWSAPSDTLAVNTTAALLAGWPLELADPTASSPAVGDVDGDGDVEIVVGANGVYAWHANGQEVIDGDNNASTFGVFSLAPGAMNASVALAELDGRPGLEIVAASWLTNKIHVWTGSGRLLPGWPVQPASGGNTGYWASPAVGDVDGDGAPEIVAVSKDGFLYAWHADGTPLLAGTNGAVRAVGAWTQTTPALADLDGDGAREMIVGGATAQVDVVRADGSDFPGWPRTLYALSKSSPAVGDVDGDGDLEIVLTTESDHVWVFAADGSNMPGWPRQANMDAPDLGPSVALGDLDGDGKLEIVLVAVEVPFPATALLVFDHQGNIRFTKPLELNTQSSPILADLDGDGGIDIVHGGEAGVLHAWNQAGQELNGFPIPLGDFVRATPAYADVDGDGRGDLVLAGWNKKVYVWTMQGAYRPERAPWPTFHGDAARTGFLRPSFPSPAAGVPAPARLAVACAPNPFNPSVDVRFQVPGAGGRVQVEIFDARGRMVRRLLQAPLPPGEHRRTWDGLNDAGRPLASGVYWVRVRAGDASATGKLTLVR